MTLNTTKTKALLLKRSPNSKVPTVLSQIEIVTSFKFLGVHIDELLHFGVHIDYVLKKANTKLHTTLSSVCFMSYT